MGEVSNIAWRAEGGSVERRCPTCSKWNRIPAKHLADTGKCGGCGAAFSPVSEPLEVDSATFDAVRENAKVPVLVDFWAEWCGPCRMVAPEVHRAAQEMNGEAIVLKVDVERHPDLGARYGVSSIPNFLVLKGGRAAKQKPGAMRTEALKRLTQD